MTAERSLWQRLQEEAPAAPDPAARQFVDLHPGVSEALLDAGFAALLLTKESRTDLLTVPAPLLNPFLGLVVEPAVAGSLTTLLLGDSGDSVTLLRFYRERPQLLLWLGSDPRLCRLARRLKLPPEDLPETTRDLIVRLVSEGKPDPLLEGHLDANGDKELDIWLTALQHPGNLAAFRRLRVQLACDVTAREAEGVDWLLKVSTDPFRQLLAELAEEPCPLKSATAEAITVHQQAKAAPGNGPTVRRFVVVARRVQAELQSHLVALLKQRPVGLWTPLKEVLTHLQDWQLDQAIGKICALRGGRRVSSTASLPGWLPSPLLLDAVWREEHLGKTRARP